jgi:hypothetical protein
VTGFDQLEPELQAAALRLDRQPRRALGNLASHIVLAASILLSIAVAIAAITLLHSTAHHVTGTQPPQPVKSYDDPAGWGVSYPRDFQLERSETARGFTSVEATIASFVPSTGVQVHVYANGGNVRQVPPLDRHGRFPLDGVAFRLADVSGNAPGLPRHEPNTPQPILLTTFRPSAGPDGALYNHVDGETLTSGGYFDAPRSVVRTIWGDGIPYTAIVWIGPDAPASARAAVGQILLSLAFRTYRRNPL